jgi:hypothetical protein
VLSFTPLPVYLRGNSPRYSMDRRLSEPQSRSGRYGDVKILYPTEDSNSDPSVVLPVASRYTDCTTAGREMKRNTQNVQDDVTAFITHVVAAVTIVMQLLFAKHPRKPFQISTRFCATFRGTRT